MAGLRGLDAFLTKEPPETAPIDVRWYVELANPHDAWQGKLGPFDTEEEAIAEAEVWVLEMRSADNSVYRDDYGYETPYSIDLNEDCTCRLARRWRKFCPVHGADPDLGYDGRR